MREFYKDFYGCAACIRIDRDGSAHLSVRAGGKLIHHKSYKNKRGVRIAMGKLSDGWRLEETWI